MSLFKTTLLVAASAATVLAQAPVPRALDPTLFSKITPSSNLTWTDCYDVFKCARYETNADVDKKRGKDKVQLAVVKLPAAGGAKNGTIHVSLGGWSDSTTSFLVQFGELYAPLFPGYDLLAIDYRGAGFSTPTFSCFKTAEERAAFNKAEPPLLGTGADNFWARYEYYEKYAKTCKKNAGDVGKYIGTYPTAHDHYNVMKADGRNKLSFWGVSSGTHVAQTIAFLWPKAVDKFMLDAPIKSDEVYDISFAQADSIQNAEKGLDYFFYACLQVDCPFKQNSSSVPELRKRFYDIDEEFLKQDLEDDDRVYTYSDFHRFLGLTLHQGEYLPVLAGLLTEVEVGIIGVATQLAYNLTYAAPTTGISTVDSVDVQIAGICADERRHLRNAKEFVSYFKDIEAKVPSVATIFANFRLACVEWRIDPVSTLEKKITKTKIAGDFLIISNVADPSASTDNAEHVAELFKPSYIVKNNAIGHTTFFGSTQSSCLFGIIFPFFNLGINPAPGTICEPDRPTFNVTLPATI